MLDAHGSDATSGDDSADTGMPEGGADGGPTDARVLDARDEDADTGGDTGTPDGPECTPSSDPSSCGIPSVCPSPKLCCAGKCVDINTDPANCGCCGQACGVSHCSTGVCCVGSGEACNPNFGCCSNLQMCSADASACP